MTLRYNHLLGITYSHGQRDCYEILRSFYRDNFSIELTAYARATDWWVYGEDLYRDHFKKEGFLQVEHWGLPDVRPADVFLISVPDPRCTVTPINHCAIYLGDGYILHHPYNRRSEKTLYARGWKAFTSMLIRHPDVQIPQVQHTEGGVSDLMNHILPHKRRELEEVFDAKES